MLMIAYENKSENMIRYFLKNENNVQLVNMRAQDGSNLLIHVTRRNDLEFMERILDSVARVHVQDFAGKAPLHHACE